GDGAERDGLAVRAGDVDVLQLLRIEALDAQELRDDLVAAARDAEAVDEVPAHRCAQILADALEVETQLRDLLAVELDLRLRLIDLGVDDGREGEHPARRRLLLDLLREAEDLARLGGGGDDDLDRERPSARQRRRKDAEGLHAGNCRDPATHLGEQTEDAALALVPRFEDGAPEPAGRLADLEGELGIRHVEEILVDPLLGLPDLPESRVRGRVHHAEDDAWSSAGANSLADCMNISTASTENTAHAA